MACKNRPIILVRDTFAGMKLKNLLAIGFSVCFYPFHAASAEGMKMTSDCLNYRVTKITSYNGQNALYLIPSTIKTNNRGIQTDACMGKYRVELMIPCRTKEGLYFKQEDGSWEFSAAPWQSDGSAAGERACDKYYF